MTDKTISQIVEEYNEVADKLGESRRTTFRDKPTALKRLEAIKQRAAGGDDEPEQPSKPKKTNRAKQRDNAAKQPAVVGKRSPLFGKKLKVTKRATELPNPRRKGTAAYDSMQIIVDNPGILYEDWRKQGGRPVDLHYDMKLGRVEAK